MNLRLQYLNGGVRSRSFKVQALKGFDEPDECRIIGVQNRYLDGSIDENILGFARIITIDFGVIRAREDKDFLWQWMINENKSLGGVGLLLTEDGGELLTESGDGIALEFENSLYVRVALENPTAFSNIWENDLVLGKRFFVRVVERDVQTIFSIGTGYGFDYGTEYGTGL